jgi:hybrid cluster-associated redox disulfide protein
MVTKEMMINDILDLDERMSEVLMSHGLNCCGCPGAGSETLEEAAKGHSVDFQKLLTALNALSPGKEE